MGWGSEHTGLQSADLQRLVSAATIFDGHSSDDGQVSVRSVSVPFDSNLITVYLIRVTKVSLGLPMFLHTRARALTSFPPPPHRGEGLRSRSRMI